MKKRRYIIIAGIAIIALMAIALIWARGPSEPSYEGKPLSFWLQRSLNDDVGASFTAVHAIGTNAIPTLLRMLRARDSGVRAKIRGLLRKLRIANSHDFDAQDLNALGAMGFLILRGEAKDAAPAIARIIEENLSPWSVQSASAALDAIGPAARDAIPVLLRAATNYSDPAAKYHVLETLARIGATPQEMAPVMIGSLSNTDTALQMSVMNDLSRLGAQSAQAVPHLVQMSTNADWRLRMSACSALGRMRLRPDIVVPALMGCLHDPDWHVRAAAASAAGKFGTDAQQAVPILQELVHDSDPKVSTVAARSLSRIESAPAQPPEHQ